MCKPCAEPTCERISYKISDLYNLKISERQTQIRSRLDVITLYTNGCCYLAVRCEVSSWNYGHCNNEWSMPSTAVYCRHFLFLDTISANYYYKIKVLTLSFSLLRMKKLQCLCLNLSRDKWYSFKFGNAHCAFNLMVT